MILFVDDEKRIMDSYVLELGLCGYVVVFETDVDVAFRFFMKNLGLIELLILDIMMPPGSIFRDVDTRMGLRTGIHFYMRIRGEAPDLPVIIFTNVSDKNVKKKFHEENKCLFLRKEDYLPFELAEEVKKLLARSDEEK